MPACIITLIPCIACSIFGAWFFCSLPTEAKLYFWNVFRQWGFFSAHDQVDWALEKTLIIGERVKEQVMVIVMELCKCISEVAISAIHKYSFICNTKKLLLDLNFTPLNISKYECQYKLQSHLLLHVVSW